MEFLSEDPTYLAGGLGLFAACLLVALRVTQQGKYLIWASASLGLALLVVGVEWLWVTDNERIEQTVYGLAKAVGESDVAAAESYMDKDVRYVTRGGTLPVIATKALMTDLVTHTRFDFLRVKNLQANAGGQSRRGTAEFRVMAGGSIERSGTLFNFGSTNSAWSLGLRETGPGVWKVNRITPVEVPRGASMLPQ